MGFPELGNDESVILQAHNIKVKSVLFEAVLTNKRLFLVDDKKGLIPTQEILTATINAVDGGENAIRDPILTFSIFARGGTARQMILTFPREASGERRRERDEWLRALNAQISSSGSPPVIPVTPEHGQPSAQNQDIASPSYPGGSAGSFSKKKIEITRPRRNIIESVPAMPRPVETTSLPTGAFCPRCGNRIPPESAFCNWCGTPVGSSTEGSSAQPPVISTTPAAPAPVIPQVQVPTLPVSGLGGNRKERTLEEVIHSIEPLIEDSKPRSSEAAPLVPRQYPAPLPSDESTGTEPLSADAQQAEPGAADAPSSTSAFPIPPARPAKKLKPATIAVLAVVVLVVIGGMVILLNSGGTPPANAVITPAISPIPTGTIATPPIVQPPSPAITMKTTPPPTPDVVIPDSGVWVRVTYAGTYSGSYGTPGSRSPVSDTGDHFYQVSTINGPVEASLQKMDGSSNTLAIEVYNNGALVKRATTVIPKGIIEFQVDLKPKLTPTPVGLKP